MNGRELRWRREGSGAGGMEGLVVGSSSDWPRVSVAVRIPSLLAKRLVTGTNKRFRVLVPLMDMVRSVTDLLELQVFRRCPGSDHSMSTKQEFLGETEWRIVKVGLVAAKQGMDGSGRRERSDAASKVKVLLLTWTADCILHLGLQRAGPRLRHGLDQQLRPLRADESRLATRYCGTWFSSIPAHCLVYGKFSMKM
jgi:hypothetical protein